MGAISLHKMGKTTLFLIALACVALICVAAPVPDTPIKCGNGKVVQTVVVRSHAINEAKVDWCYYTNATNKECSLCLDHMPAQPGNTTIAIGASADFFVFALKGSEAGKETELYPDTQSGEWPQEYDLQDPKNVAVPAPNAPIKCGNGKVVQTVVVRSHAINEAKVDWCYYTTIAIGASADFFVFALK